MMSRRYSSTTSQPAASVSGRPPEKRGLISWTATPPSSPTKPCTLAGPISPTDLSARLTTLVTSASSNVVALHRDAAAGLGAPAGRDGDDRAGAVDQGVAGELARRPAGSARSGRAPGAAHWRSWVRVVHAMTSREPRPKRGLTIHGPGTPSALASPVAGTGKASPRRWVEERPLVDAQLDRPTAAASGCAARPRAGSPGHRPAQRYSSATVQIRACASEMVADPQQGGQVVRVVGAGHDMVLGREAAARRRWGRRRAAMTWWPRARRARMTATPAGPPAPVTSTRTGLIRSRSSGGQVVGRSRRRAGRAPGRCRVRNSLARAGSSEGGGTAPATPGSSGAAASPRRSSGCFSA